MSQPRLHRVNRLQRRTPLPQPDPAHVPPAYSRRLTSAVHAQDVTALDRIGLRSGPRFGRRGAVSAIPPYTYTAAAAPPSVFLRGEYEPFMYLRGEFAYWTVDLKAVGWGGGRSAGRQRVQLPRCASASCRRRSQAGAR